MKDSKYKITIENTDGDTMSMTLNNPDHISSWSHPFIVLLTWIGFQPLSISELINDEEL